MPTAHHRVLLACLVAAVSACQPVTPVGPAKPKPTAPPAIAAVATELQGTVKSPTGIVAGGGLNIISHNGNAIVAGAG